MFPWGGQTGNRQTEQTARQSLGGMEEYEEGIREVRGCNEEVTLEQRPRGAQEAWE